MKKPVVKILLPCPFNELFHLIWGDIIHEDFSKREAGQNSASDLSQEHLRKKT